MCRLNFDGAFFMLNWDKEHAKSFYKLLQHYLDSKIEGKIKSFRVSVPLYCQFWQHIDAMNMVADKRLKDYEIGDKNGSYRWVRLAIQMGAKEVNLTYLDEDYDSPFSFEILSGILPSKLKHLRLQTFSIAPPAAPKVISDDQPLVLHSLATLELDDLQVSLANLTYFEYRIKERQGVHLKPKLSFSKYLKLVSDVDLDRQGYDEYNPVRRQMVYPKPKISLSNVPKLEEMRLDLDLQRYNQTVDDMFITADAPQLERLTTIHTSSMIKLLWNL
ncbi:hypothetical protein COLO4_31622 [Corchorus olitorius]|uniref:Uncharacterized protein n=1 Tax=Corchorus olitorius TaxID=93759 RepID=A0A1R3H3T7_9ROSI|nr:hypothetical protein COLO4_31622 [Corchorus olitorius]